MMSTTEPRSSERSIEPRRTEADSRAQRWAGGGLARGHRELRTTPSEREVEPGKHGRAANSEGDRRSRRGRLRRVDLGLRAGGTRGAGGAKLVEGRRLRKRDDPEDGTRGDPRGADTERDVR